MIGISRSTITNSPLFEQRKQISAVTSVREYKMAASTSTRTIGIKVPLVPARAVVTLRSIAHIRYAINPEPDTLAAIVETKYAMIYVARFLVKTLVVDSDCETL